MTFEGSISEAFEPVLRFYVAEEERELNTHLEAVLREEYENRCGGGGGEVGGGVRGLALVCRVTVHAAITLPSDAPSPGRLNVLL